MAPYARRWRAGDAEAAAFPSGSAGDPARPVLPRVATLLNLVQIVQDYAHNDDEVVAVITELLRSRRVTLCGIFAGRTMHGPDERRSVRATPRGVGG